MTITEYAELAQRTASTKTKDDKVGHGCLGLIGEAGEIIDIVKKMRYMGMTDEISKAKLTDEASDCLWYLVELCEGLNYNVSDVLDAPRNGLYEFKYKPNTIYSAAIEIILAIESCLEPDDVASTIANFTFVDLAEIADCILFILKKIHVSLEYTMKYNIEKLSQRYPEHVFSADRSNERYV